MKDIHIKHKITHIIGLAGNLNASVTWLVEGSVTVRISTYNERLDHALKDDLMLTVSPCGLAAAKVAAW